MIKIVFNEREECQNKEKQYFSLKKAQPTLSLEVTITKMIYIDPKNEDKVTINANENKVFDCEQKAIFLFAKEDVAGIFEDMVEMVRNDLDDYILIGSVDEIIEEFNSNS